MFNQDGIKVQEIMSTKQILADVKTFHSIGCRVSSATAVEQDDGSFILYAGTPVTGILGGEVNFEAATTANGVSNAVGILLHDVKFTSQADSGNATLLLMGMVKMNNMPGASQLLITDEVKAALPTIKFV